MSYAWFDLGDGRQVYRRVVEHVDRRSDLPSPMIASDTMDAVQSAADGNFYTSKSALRETYKPSGNREGVRFLEVGNDPSRLKPRERKTSTSKEIRQSIKRALGAA